MAGMYLEFYGFSEQPFNVTPDPRFLFFTESHREALSAMIYGISERKGFVSVSGEVGIGKTTLVHQLLSSLDLKIRVVVISQTKITFEQLLREVLLELGLPVGYEDKPSLIRRFKQYLESRRPDENLAILVDEAQHLSIEAMEDLRLLSNLETATSRLLQVVFVGQPELEGKLNCRELRQLKQRIVIRRRILPLREGDCRMYIEHRLNIVGSSTPQVFIPDAVAMIARHSRGIPRVINILCDNALLIGYSRGRKKVNALLVQEAISHMEALAPAEAGEKTRAEKRERARRGFRRRMPAWPYAAAAVLALLMAILLGREFGGALQEKLWPPFPVSPPAREQRIAAPAVAPLLPGATPPQAAPAAPLETPPAAQPPLPPPVLSSAPLNAPAAARPEIRVESATAKAGETLRSLSLAYYKFSNTTVLDYLLQFNPEIEDPDLVKANQKIFIPQVEDQSLILEARDGTCQLHLGTFLDPRFAENYRTEPALQGKRLEVLPRKFRSGQTWYRAVAAGFASREECLQTIQALKAKSLLPLLKNQTARAR